MTKLAKLAEANGYTIKLLSDVLEIKYTTLISMGKRNKFTNEVIQKLATTIGVSTREIEEALKKGPVNPFIKWVGGKRQLLPELLKYMPQNFETYYEPFIGGGALFLRVAPERAIINDYNEELINTWRMVEQNPSDLIKSVSQHAANDSREYYLSLRMADRDGRIAKMSNLERASRFIYMNKAGYNGLWRVNSKGQNNVPWGAHKKVNIPTNEITNVSEYIRENDVKILQGDYRNIIDSVTTNDFVYFDPPYIPVTPTSAFTSYTKNGFGKIQQEELRDVALTLSKKGAKVMLSNADVPLIEKLYIDPIFKIHHVRAKRMINSNGLKRGKVGEVIITTY
ncbi:DNA adenine methylase [Pediococcus pentosaceus]|jgi:DNA adenine methylase|uniref:DNA adenine methylase n=1 Tax=Pediococcus pentosaceus TaxID=1255 RepID=UPI0026595B7B|nr:DNA adenine methylase [Pediococcus pentosaceus]WKF71256.1 DNA adenine methylase [Pediococcus pentosaceus]